MFGLEPDINKHKALAHDMHAESNAFRQRFVPQSVLRSSWQQLVMSGLEPDISFRFPCKHGNDRGEEKNTEMMSSSDKRSAFRGSLDIRVIRSA
jgi:hypothetical protein